MVGSSNCAQAVVAVVAAAVVAAVEDSRSKGVADTLPTVVGTGEGHDRTNGTSAEVHFPVHRHEVRQEEVRVTVVVCVGTEEGSCLRAVDTVGVVDAAAADGGNEAAAALHDSPWVTLVAYLLVLD
jgi:hypothetical protein